MKLQLLLLSSALLLNACNKKPALFYVSHAVVELHMTFQGGNKGIASGFYVSEDGLIMTARHCVKGIKKIEVVTAEGRTYVAKVVLISETDDIALIKIARSGTPYLKLAARSPEVGDIVQAIGSPLGIINTYVRGCISSNWGNETLLDITMLPGFSGCPILNERNEVVGVGSKFVVFRQAATHLGVMVSWDVVKDFTEQFTLIPVSIPQLY